MALYQPDLQTGDAHPFASYLDVHQGYMVLTYISVLHDSLRGVPTLSWGQKGVVGLDTMHPCWTFTTNYSPSLKKCPGGTSPSFKGTCRASPQKIEHQRKLKKRLGNQLDRLCLFGEPHWNLQRKRKFWLQKVSETCRHAQSLWEGPSIMINLVAKSAFSPPPRWGSLDFNRGATHSLPPSFLPSYPSPDAVESVEPHCVRWFSQLSSMARPQNPSFRVWFYHFNTTIYRWCSLIFTSNNFQVSCFFPHQNLHSSWDPWDPWPWMAMAMPRYDYCDPQILGWAETSVKSPDQVLPGDWHFPAEAPWKTWGFRQGKSMGCKEGSHLHGKLGCNPRMPKKKSWRYTLNVLKSDMCIVCISEFNIFRHI